jgi:hypothetical protein
MANLSQMRGSIGLDVNAVCHVALLKRTGKEREKDRQGVGESDCSEKPGVDKIPELHP